MTRPVSLARLRGISKQRSIRQPPLMSVLTESTDDRCDLSAAKIEWPIPS